MRVKFWGVRGSIASSGSAVQQVGGNTSCVEVRCGEQVIVLDAGTGLRDLGVELFKRGGAIDVAILVSHFHWDHIQGFPFFGPAYAPNARVNVYGGAADVRAAFAAQMTAPHFPVGLDAMRAKLGFYAVAPGEVFQIGSVTVRTAAARHPNDCLVYRLEYGGASVVYATDTEHREDGAIDPELLAIARGCDLLIYDAQYTPEEYASKRGWGHSTAEEGARLARAAGARRLALFHHDPGHDDWQVARIEARTRALHDGAVAAREGLVLDVTARAEGAAA